MKNKLIELIKQGIDYAHKKCDEIPNDRCETCDCPYWGGEDDPDYCGLLLQADYLLANGVTIQDKKEEHPMRYKNFEIREILSQHPKYEVLRWFDTTHNGKPWCYVVAFIRWNPKEPCWVFESVGTRFIDDYENGLCEFISMFLKDKTPAEEE